MMRRRRPLLRGAMVGGAGYMAGKSAARRGAQEEQQEQRLEGLESQQAPAGPPPGGLGTDTIEQLKQLAGLRDSGVLTPEEFDREKQKLLGG
jgi:Short C-terminal domain